MPARRAFHEALELIEAGQVEVVGRLVEQQDVVAGQQQRREADPRRLAAGQPGHEGVESHTGGDLGDHFLGPLVQVGPAEGEPVLERVPVALVGAVPPGGQLLGRLVEGPLRDGHTGAPSERGQHRLPRTPLVLLRQVAEAGRRRTDHDAARLRRDVPGQRAQQRGLARAVDAHEPHHVAGRDDEIQTGEQHAGAMTGRQSAGDEGGAHPYSLPISIARPTGGSHRAHGRAQKGGSSSWGGACCRSAVASSRSAVTWSTPVSSAAVMPGGRLTRVTPDGVVTLSTPSGVIA